MTYLTRAALLATGLTDADIRGQVSAGKLHRVGRGRYTREVLKSPRQQHLALARQETGILGLESAALLHGLAVAKVPALLQLVEPESSNVRRRQDKCIWGSRVNSDEIVTVEGDSGSTPRQEPAKV